mgnify:CR=1 FL=1
MYKKLADLFEQYAKERGWFTARHDSDGRVDFFGGQESITFIDEGKLHQDHMGEVTVYIPWDLIGIATMGWT